MGNCRPCGAAKKRAPTEAEMEIFAEYTFNPRTSSDKELIEDHRKYTGNAMNHLGYD